MDRLTLKAVLAGAVADLVATNLATLPLLIYAASRIDLPSLPQPQQTPALLAAIKTNSPLYVGLFLLGSLCSVLGGYVAGVVAKRERVLNGAWSAFLCVGVGLWLLVEGKEQMPVWLHVLYLLLSPALGALGGYLRQAQGAS
jgi:hypothetical protein